MPRILAPRAGARQRLRAPSTLNTDRLASSEFIPRQVSLIITKSCDRKMTSARSVDASRATSVGGCNPPSHHRRTAAGRHSGVKLEAYLSLKLGKSTSLGRRLVKRRRCLVCSRDGGSRAEVQRLLQGPNQSIVVSRFSSFRSPCSQRCSPDKSFRPARAASSGWRH